MVCDEHRYKKKGNCDDCDGCRVCPPPEGCGDPFCHIIVGGQGRSKRKRQEQSSSSSSSSSSVLDDTATSCTPQPAERRSSKRPSAASAHREDSDSDGGDEPSSECDDRRQRRTPGPFLPEIREERAAGRRDDELRAGGTTDCRIVEKIPRKSAVLDLCDVLNLDETDFFDYFPKEGYDPSDLLDPSPCEVSPEQRRRGRSSKFKKASMLFNRVFRSVSDLFCPGNPNLCGVALLRVPKRQDATTAAVGGQPRIEELTAAEGGQPRIEESKRRKKDLERLASKTAELAVCGSRGVSRVASALLASSMSRPNVERFVNEFVEARTKEQRGRQRAGAEKDNRNSKSVSAEEDESVVPQEDRPGLIRTNRKHFGRVRTKSSKQLFEKLARGEEIPTSTYSYRVEPRKLDGAVRFLESVLELKPGATRTIRIGDTRIKGMPILSREGRTDGSLFDLYKKVTGDDYLLGRHTFIDILQALTKKDQIKTGVSTAELKDFFKSDRPPHFIPNQQAGDRSEGAEKKGGKRNEDLKVRAFKEAFERSTMTPRTEGEKVKCGGTFSPDWALNPASEEPKSPPLGIETTEVSYDLYKSDQRDESKKISGDQAGEFLLT